MAAAYVVAVAFFFALRGTRGVRNIALGVAIVAICLTPFLIPADEKVRRMVGAIWAVALLVKVHDTYRGALVGYYPRLVSYAAWLPNLASIVQRKLARAPRPDRGGDAAVARGFRAGRVHGNRYRAVRPSHGLVGFALCGGAHREGRSGVCNGRTDDVGRRFALAAGGRPSHRPHESTHSGTNTRGFLAAVQLSGAPVFSRGYFSTFGGPRSTDRGNPRGVSGLGNCARVPLLGRERPRARVSNGVFSRSGARGGADCPSRTFWGQGYPRNLGNAGFQSRLLDALFSIDE